MRAGGTCCSLLLAALCCSLSAEPLRNYSESRAPCADHNPHNNLYWGDLHVHTRLSLDASTQDTRTTPAQAYEFARGAELGIQPWRDGKALRRIQLRRPLDFAAVTDHAELLGEVALCTNPDQAAYTGMWCRVFRAFPRVSFYLFNYTASRGRRLGMCGDDGELCRAASAGPWQQIREAAEAAYDRSDQCRFTSFVGYEWTGASEALGNTHRNVIFRNADVPPLPTSFIDSGKQAERLYQQLDSECIAADGACDVLIIPHNSNLSDGAMFPNATPDGSPLGREAAATRRRFEPLVELLQHKGSSECYYEAGLTRDELCAFEQLPYDKFSSKFQPWQAERPTPHSGFMREVLRDGLSQRARLGVNPFQLGFIGSTDTHLGIPGAVSEADFPGHGGAGAPSTGDLPRGLVDDLEFNPGGLAAIWAPENSRDALFDAMLRRETYATSGPRIELRMFAAEQLPGDLCADTDLVAQGYRLGQPMGSELEGLQSFQLLAAARRDPLSLPLQRLQVVKGWIDAAGVGRETVLDVAGDADNGATVDLASCEPRGEGFDSLCTVWGDPEFSPGEQAYYYVRAVENPSCRWSQRVCAARGVDCANPRTISDGLEACCSEQHRPVIQERAVSSPVWYVPGKP